MALVLPRMKTGLGRAFLDATRRIHVKKVNPCYTPICDVEFDEPAKSSIELCNAGIYIKKHYIPFEPVLVTNPVGQLQTLIQYYKTKAEDGKMLYAKSGKQLLGIIIGHRIVKNEYEGIMDIYDKINEKTTKNYFGYLAALEKRQDLNALHNVKHVFNIDILITGIEFRRRGLSKQLIDAILKELVMENYDMVKMATSTDYAAKGAAYNGFKTAYQVEPHTLRDKKGLPFVPNIPCFPHKETKIMVKDLKKIQRNAN